MLLAAQAATVAQNPPDAPPPAVFQTGVQLVQVRVIAEDKDRKPVTDLRQEEFRLLDNGLPQDIRLFLNESERSSVAPPPLPPGTFTNRGASRPGEHSGYSVIVLDTLLTGLADENQGGSGAIWAIQKALLALHSLPAGENVAIYATGYKVWVVREFTQDRESLELKLRKWKPAQDVIPAIDKPDCAAPGNRADRRACRRHPGTEESNLGRVHFSGHSTDDSKTQDARMSRSIRWTRMVP